MRAFSRPALRPAIGWRPRCLGLVVLCGLLGAVLPHAVADVLVPSKGKKVEGALVSDEDDTIVFNVYWSRNPGVTNPEHVIRLPKSEVKRVELEPRPEVEVFRRLKAVADGDAAAFLAVGAYAKEHKLKGPATMCFALALAADPENGEALKAIGGRGRWDTARKGNVFLDGELRAILERYIAEEDPRERERMARTLKERGFAAKPHELERYRRSIHSPKGYQQDRPIAYRSDRQPGAVYTLYVPDAYTPWKPWPFIVGLHGGGPGGKAGDEVVGSGPSAMNFYRDLAARHGYIVACPTARSAGWGSKDNETFVRDVMTEVQLLYNVDIDRIYLTGHSMGGFGTWALGPRMADMLAAVSPMAGGGGTTKPLVDTRTPIFIYHSADDNVVGPSSDRAHAKSLLGSGHDFVYTELPDAKHGMPESVRNELFAFFEPRRRYDKKYKDAWPRSSFLAKVTSEEVRYLGDPMEALKGETPDLATLVGHLKLGGGRAVLAAAKLAERGADAEAAKAVAKVCGNAKWPFDARAYAARALGALKRPEGAAALRKAVAMPAEREQSLVAREAANALVALQDADGLKMLVRAIDGWTGYYESKVSGSSMGYSDWGRSVGTLTVLVGAWAELATEGDDASAIERAVVAKVFEPAHEVQTSPRVPQDPSTARALLAGAVGKAYARTGADDKRWERLLEALASDSTARAAAAAARP